MDGMRFCLILLLVVPAATAIFSALLGQQRLVLIRRLCLGATLVNVVLAFVLVGGYIEARRAHGSPMLQKEAVKTFQPELVPGADPADPHRTTWNLIPLGDAGAVQFFLGLDGINLWLIVLTALLLVSSVLISWNSIQERANEYYAWLLALGTGMFGVFLAFDIILFYIFFELTLVPLFFLIGMWGGPERRHAARKFFIYTLAGSLITFLGLLALVVASRQGGTLTFSIPELVRAVAENRLTYAFQFWVFLALVAGFAIKVPLVPLHTWLPLAHVEAPTAGSVLLAGVLLKIGTYGFLRFCLPLTPEACHNVGLPLIGTLSVIGILYGAFCSLAQSDIKKLVAYSSVSHLGFCMLGMFALNQAGLVGSLLQMINHGLSTGGLFLLVGMLYERYHTRRMTDYGGMGARLGLLSVCMVFVALSSIGLPGLNGFVGEALVFFAMFDVRPVLAVLGTGGILLGAWYLLSMVRQVFFGTLKEPQTDDPHEHGQVTDLSAREICALAPILVLCLVLGVYPQPVIDVAAPDLEVVSKILQQRPRPIGPVATAPVIHGDNEDAN